MIKSVAKVALIAAAVVAVGDALAHRPFRLPEPAGDDLAFEREAQAYEELLGCDFRGAFAKYGDEIDARRACHGLLFH